MLCVTIFCSLCLPNTLRLRCWERDQQPSMKGPGGSMNFLFKAPWRKGILTTQLGAGPSLGCLLGRQRDLAAVISWHKYLTACPSQ